MGYDLHIQRANRNRPITLEEWRNAVSASSEFRLASGDHLIINPRTRENITTPNSGGDVEVLLPSSEWVRAFRLSRGGIVSFSAKILADHSSLAPAVFALAHRLHAAIVGDDGEEYGPEDFSEPLPKGSLARMSAQTHTATEQVIKKPWWRFW